MPTLGDVIARLNLPTGVAAVALVVLVFAVIKLGKILLMAGVFGVVAGGAELARGLPPKTAIAHAVVAFVGAGVLFFLVKLAKGMLMSLVITAIGVAILLMMGACSRSDGGTVRLPASGSQPSGSDEPPVMVSPESPVEYPPALFNERIEGKVVLRMFVDAEGAVVSDSTRIAESSGYPALDSAALRAAPSFRFAPALRRGEPVATLFLQPVHFRHPEAGGLTP